MFTVKEVKLKRNNPVTHLRLMDSSSGDVRALTSAEITDCDPCWGPDENPGVLLSVLPASPWATARRGAKSSPSALPALAGGNRIPRPTPALDLIQGVSLEELGCLTHNPLVMVRECRRYQPIYSGRSPIPPVGPSLNG